MTKNNETTTKFKVDISELKSEFQQAQRVIRVANSEFKAASATMDNWTESADGLSAKIEQLSTVLDAEKTKLKSLAKQYELTAKEQGENSKGAQDLLVKLNNQRAAVAKLETELGKWKTSLNEIEKESTDLVQTISKQESELVALKNNYANVISTQGKGSSAAKELETAIGKLSTELRENKTALANARQEADKFDNALDDVDDAAENAQNGIGTFQIALGNLIADGIGNAVDGLKNMVTELVNVEGAYSKFQAATGATTEEMAEFKEEMNDLYKSGFGESVEEIGDKMAYVKQVTGEVDPSKIRKLTENAMALEDTFGSDFNETLRGVTNMMEHFGIDAEEAFDLFAKGSQEGLDYTSELGDNVAEYGGNFAQAGYSAEEYFQLLKNGAEGGAYNLDKVNDSINEVKNRLGDGTIEKNITLFSEGTQKTFGEWQNGEKTMKDVIDSIVKDITECTDEQKALTMAAEAFGTMGEDANLEVVKSLTTLGDEFDAVGGKMEEIKEIRYSSVTDEFKQLGRTVQTDIILPLVEKALPKIKEGIKWVADNLDTLIPIVTTLGGVFATMWAVSKISAFVKSISSVITMVKGLTTATTAQTAAQTALNATNPFGWVVLAVGAIGALTAAVMSSIPSYEEMRAEFAKLDEEEQKLRDTTNEMSEAFNSFTEAKAESITGVSSEFGYYEELKAELDSIVDANGKVKKGYEDRAAVITSILSEALGTEIQITDGVIQKYGELKKSIEDVIQTKKAEAMLSALEDEYTTAIMNKNDALTNYRENLAQFNAVNAEYVAATKEYQELKNMGLQAWADENGLVASSSGTMIAYAAAVKAAQIETYGLGDKQTEQNEALQKSEETYLGYIETIQQYEGLSSSIIGGDTDKINESLLELEYGFITAENGTKDSLERQVQNYKEQLDDLKQAINDKTPGVTQAQVDQMQELVTKSEAELAKLAPKAEAQGEKGGEGFENGMESKEGAVKAEAENLASEAEEGLETVESEDTGESFAQGFINGMKGLSSNIWTAAWNIGEKALDAIKEATDTHSPSREAMAIGKFFAMGFANAIRDNSSMAEHAAVLLGESTMKALNESFSMEDDFKNSLQADLTQAKSTIASSLQPNLSQNVSDADSATNSKSGNVTNFYQYNTSPKALSRLDIYRQTNNMLNFTGGGK